MITSVDTSRKQIPSIVSSLNVEGQRILNFGAGKYPELTKELLEQMGASEVVSYDPHAKHELNLDNFDSIKGRFDKVLCCNVLNVLEDCDEVVEQLLSIDTDKLLVQIYEGNCDSIGTITTCGYQRNEPTETYTKYFPNGHRVGNLITVHQNWNGILIF